MTTAPSTSTPGDQWELLALHHTALHEGDQLPIAARPRWIYVIEGSATVPGEEPVLAGDAALVPPGPDGVVTALEPTRAVEALLHHVPALHDLPRTLVVAGFERRHAGVAALVEQCPLTAECISPLFVHSYGGLIGAAMTASWQERSLDRVREPSAVDVLVAALGRQPDRPWTLDDMAAHAHLSRSALTEQFRRRTGRSPMQVLRDVRMARARALLRLRGHTISHVALSVGYGSNAAFTRAFVAAHGTTPQQWRDERSAARGA